MVSDIIKDTYTLSYPAGDVRIVVGRYYTDHDDYFPTAKIDEILYFNSALTPDQILSIYNGV